VISLTISERFKRCQIKISTWAVLIFRRHFRFAKSLPRQSGTISHKNRNQNGFTTTIITIPIIKTVGTSFIQRKNFAEC